MNHLYVGLNNAPELPKADFLFIHDTVPKFKQARIFDPLKHSFNPLKDLDYRRACTIVDIFDALFERGGSTLTKDTGLEYLSDELDANPRTIADLVPTPDKKSTTGHIWAYGKVRRIMRSPVLKKVFCGKPNFHFNEKSVILARINKAELGRFDALALALFLINEFPGQIVIPNFGRYARPFHEDLIEEERLIAGVQTLSQIKDDTLRDRCLLMPKEGRQCTFEDAEVLARYDGKVPRTKGYEDAIETYITG